MSVVLRCPHCGVDHYLEGDFTNFKCNCFQQRITDMLIRIENRLKKLEQNENQNPVLGEK